MNPIPSLGALTALLLMATSAAAGPIDGVAVCLGDGLAGVEMARISLLARQKDPPPGIAGWNLNIHWEFDLAAWRVRRFRRGAGQLFEASVTPVLRLSLPWPAARPYAEFGLGAHVLSDDRIGDRVLSTSYQFGSHLGVGLVMGARHAWELGVRFQHLSNAGLETPNPGMDFVIARVARRF
jgi:lipid A 3-O-deacylase